jgi:hypothetical protein
MLEVGGSKPSPPIAQAASRFGLTECQSLTGLAVVARAGFEPAISALKGLRPSPLDDRAVLGSLGTLIACPVPQTLRATRQKRQSGRSTMVVRQPSKLFTWVRFPSPAPTMSSRSTTRPKGHKRPYPAPTTRPKGHKRPYPAPSMRPKGHKWPDPSAVFVAFSPSGALSRCAQRRCGDQAAGARVARGASHLVRRARPRVECHAHALERVTFALGIT